MRHCCSPAPGDVSWQWVLPPSRRPWIWRYAGVSKVHKANGLIHVLYLHGAKSLPYCTWLFRTVEEIMQVSHGCISSDWLIFVVRWYTWELSWWRMICPGILDWGLWAVHVILPKWYQILFKLSGASWMNQCIWNTNMLGLLIDTMQYL